jgi:hypothetical protein
MTSFNALHICPPSPIPCVSGVNFSLDGRLRGPSSGRLSFFALVLPLNMGLHLNPPSPKTCSSPLLGSHSLLWVRSLVLRSGGEGGIFSRAAGRIGAVARRTAETRRTRPLPEGEARGGALATQGRTYLTELVVQLLWAEIEEQN